MFDYKTALNQLTNSNNGMGRLVAMIGAKNFARGDNWVSFAWGMKAANKSNYCKITLDPSDTYSVEFGYLRGGKYFKRSEISGMYADQLKNYYESETCNYLSF